MWEGSFALLLVALCLQCVGGGGGDSISREGWSRPSGMRRWATYACCIPDFKF